MVLKSWVDYPIDSDFSIHNIPFGVAVFKNEYIACASRIGDQIIDLASLYDLGYFNNIPELDENVFDAYVLNPFIELGKTVTNKVRLHLQSLLLEGSLLLKDDNATDNCFYQLEEVQMILPLHIPNYSDFYSSEDHARNIGIMLRGADNALMPNWKHLPVAYHGRSSSIVVSGVDIIRPKGQTKAADADQPIFGPTKAMDFELEMAFVVNKNTELGDCISTAEAKDAIFGMVIFNDWSARDIQAWEYVPLGPFLAKNFGSSISPWVVTLEALQPFQTKSPQQDPDVLDYLKFDGENENYDINLDVYLQTPNGEENLVSASNYKYMYWNMLQQLAHHTVNGCNVEVGDLYASGTISGPEKSSFGSMMELSWRGAQPLKMKDGTERKYLEDGDVIRIKGYSEKDGIRVGFGEVSAKILPAK